MGFAWQCAWRVDEILAVWFCRAACRRDIPVGNNGHQRNWRVRHWRSGGVGCRTRDFRGGAAMAVRGYRISACYTTVSSFSLQTLALARDGEMARAVGNVALSLSLCLTAVACGFAAGLRAFGKLAVGSATQYFSNSAASKQVKKPPVSPLTSFNPGAKNLGNDRFVYFSCSGQRGRRCGPLSSLCSVREPARRRLPLEHFVRQCGRLFHYRVLCCADRS